MQELQFNSPTMERFILAYLIKDKSFFLKIGKLLKTKDYSKKSYFTDNKLQWLLNVCCVYYNKYDRVPSIETAKMFSEGQFKKDELLKKAIDALIDEIYSKDLSEIEPDYIKDETVKFVKAMRAVEATNLNALDIANGKFDALNDRMQKAVNINLDKDLGVSLANIEESLSLIQEVEEDSGMTFGTPALDRILGSPKAGELYVYAAPPACGKTIHLGNVAVENMKLGKKGVFFSLEVDKRRLAKRLYSSLLYKSGVDIMSTTKEEAEAIFASFNGGDVKIKNYPANTSSCNDFAAYLNDLYTLEGFKPDFICVDYILITAPNNKKAGDDNMYQRSKYVAEELRNLATQFECPVFSASQINRSGMGDKGGTKGMVTSKDLAESRAILDTADALIVINQTDTEKKLAEKDGIGEQRLYIDKNRNGCSGDILTITLDYNTMTIKDGKKQRSI